MSATMPSGYTHWRSPGFTLIELLIVLLVTALLMSVAVPGYREHQVTVQRTEALQALQAAHQCEARQRLQGVAGAARRCTPGPSVHYNYLLIDDNRGMERRHEWRAEPRGAQKTDPCGTLVLDHLGGKRVLGSVRPPQTCWQGR